ncbi:MAG: hydrogenase maturation nickel metallochaperone HypA [Planctomycetota bacterium]
MHEMTVARSVVDAIEAAIAAGRVAGRVRRVVLRVGRLRAVAPKSLRFLFPLAAEGTPLAGSALDIVEVAVRGRCERCAGEFVLEAPRFLCPGCGAAEIAVTAGDELTIESVEVDR